MNLYTLLFAFLFALLSLSTTAYGQCTQSLTNGASASVVYGQTSFTASTTSSTLSGLSSPAFVAVDPVGRATYISDQANHRVLRFPAGQTTADIYFGNPAQPNITLTSFLPAGLTFDASGNLYVADQSANRVLVFLSARSVTTNSKAADVVFGQVSASAALSGSAANQFNFPEGLWYDQTRSRLFVADSSNARVVFFDNPSLSTTFPNPSATGVVGASTFTNKPIPVVASQSSMDSPFSVVVDSKGNLWVADFGFNRVTRYPLASYTAANGANADNVLGQNGYTATVTTNPTVNLNFPYALAIDTADDSLYVSDSNNNRVLVYFAANGATFSNANSDRQASLVLGQSTFTSTSADRGTGTPAANSLDDPKGLFYDPITPRLYVTDSLNNRVLGFCSSAQASPSPVTSLASSPAASAPAASPASSQAATKSTVFTSPISQAPNSGLNRSPIVLLSPVGVTASPNPNVVDICLRLEANAFYRKASGICQSVFGGTVIQTQRVVVRKNGKGGPKDFFCCTGIPKATLTSFSFTWKGDHFHKLRKFCAKASGKFTRTVNKKTSVVRNFCRSP